MDICFLDKTEFSYNSYDRFDSNLRGAENTLINLSEEFAKLGHNVTVFNNTKENKKINNINWFNINNLTNKTNVFDVAFSNNDCNFFDLVQSKKNFLISYSLQNFEKFIRKKQFFSYFKHKPKIITLGKYHTNNRSKLLSLFGVIELNLAVDNIFINTQINDDFSEDVAIFNSRPDRNMALLTDIWKNYIHPFHKSAKLLLTPTKMLGIKDVNIHFRRLLDKDKYIEDLLASKIVLLPGHKAELYCIAADEARELCIPVVTLGIGSLSERVNHGITGFIAKDSKEFGRYTLDLFKDQIIWKEMRNNLIKIRGEKTWKDVANNLLLKL
jgi:hypothetical protein